MYLLEPDVSFRVENKPTSVDNRHINVNVNNFVLWVTKRNARRKGLSFIEKTHSHMPTNAHMQNDMKVVRKTEVGWS